MSYVDMMGNVRWTEQAHIARVELMLRSSVTHTREHVLYRRVISVLAEAVNKLIPPAPTDGSTDPFADVRSVVGGLAAYFVPLTVAAQQELGAAAPVMSQIDALAAQARADSALLDNALDYEAIRAQRDALPPLPVPDPVTGITPPDPLSPDERAQVEAERTTLQGEMDAYDQPTKDLVAQRDAWRTAQNPLPADQQQTQGATT